MSELSAKTFASRFQAMGMALDIPQKQMAKMSVRLTALTGDMASFYDVAQEDVAKSLQSIFSGTTMPMRRYGVDLTQATLNEWLMKQGIDADVKSMSQAQKAMVRYQYTLQQTQMVTDDFQRTSTSWHNTLTVLHENFKELGKTVGTIAINAFKPFLRALNIVMQKVNSFIETVTSALGAIFGWKFEISNGGASDLADDLNDAYGYMDDLSESADSASDNTGQVAKNAKKAKKEIQQATRAFDELKTISKQNSNSSSGSGNSGGSGNGSVGQWVETPTKYEEFESSIKDLEGLGTSIRDALVNAVGGIKWEEVYTKASGFGTGLAEFLNGLFSADKKGNSVFTATADVIAGALNTAIFASKGFTKKFDFETFGKNVANGFNRFFKKFKWKQCAEAINGWVDGFWKTVKGFFSDLSWKDIFDGLKTFLTNLSPTTITTIIGAKVFSKLGKNFYKLVKDSITKDLDTKLSSAITGSTTIKAKVGKKTLSCKVTVKNKFSASEATKNISVTLQNTGKGVVAILKNNNSTMVDIDAKLVYFSNGRMIDTSSDFVRAFESGKECALFFIAPMDGDYEYVSYDDYKITLSVSKASYEKSKVNGVDVEADRGADNITAEIFNNSGMDYEFVKVAVVFYDAGNNAIGYDYTYANCLKDGSVDYISFDYPYDSDYETIYPSNYKIYVNEAYASTW